MITHDSIRAFQSMHRNWVEHNFPGQTPHQPLLGIVEEVGELAHSHLKYDQEIRGIDWAEYHDQAVDAVGDIMIYIASYCNAAGLDMASCLETTWEVVSERDWIQYPETGRPPVDAEQPAAEVSGPDHRDLSS